MLDCSRCGCGGVCGPVIATGCSSRKPESPVWSAPLRICVPDRCAHLGALDVVYHYDMKLMKNWGPHGPGYYSCGPNGCTPYGGMPCCGLTPLHYNQDGVAPALLTRPYPARPGATYYDAHPVAYQPVPGWDIPEFPPGVKPPGYTTMRGFIPYRKHTPRPGVVCGTRAGAKLLHPQAAVPVAAAIISAQKRARLRGRGKTRLPLFVFRMRQRLRTPR